MLGWRNNCEKQPPMGKRRNISFVITIANSGPLSRVAATSGIKILKTPYHAPRANAICERFMRSVRQACLDHLLIFQEKQLQRVLNAYVAYFNQARPHQGIAQRIPEQRSSVSSAQHAGTRSLLFRSWVDCTMTTTGQPEAKPRGRVYSWWTRSI